MGMGRLAGSISGQVAFTLLALFASLILSVCAAYGLQGLFQTPNIDTGDWIALMTAEFVFVALSILLGELVEEGGANEDDKSMSALSTFTVAIGVLTALGTHAAAVLLSKDNMPDWVSSASVGGALLAALLGRSAGMVYQAAIFAMLTVTGAVAIWSALAARARPTLVRGEPGPVDVRDIEAERRTQEARLRDLSSLSVEHPVERSNLDAQIDAVRRRLRELEEVTSARRQLALPPPQLVAASTTSTIAFVMAVALYVLNRFFLSAPVAGDGELAVEPAGAVVVSGALVGTLLAVVIGACVLMRMAFSSVARQATDSRTVVGTSIHVAGGAVAAAAACLGLLAAAYFWGRDLNLPPILAGVRPMFEREVLTSIAEAVVRLVVALLLLTIAAYAVLFLARQMRAIASYAVPAVRIAMGLARLGALALVLAALGFAAAGAGRALDWLGVHARGALAWAVAERPASDAVSAPPAATILPFAFAELPLMCISGTGAEAGSAPAWAYGDDMRVAAKVEACRLQPTERAPEVVIALGLASGEGGLESEGRRALMRGWALARSLKPQLGSAWTGRLYVLNVGQRGAGVLRPAFDAMSGSTDRRLIAYYGDRGGSNAPLDDAAALAAIRRFVEGQGELAAYTRCDLYRFDAAAVDPRVLSPLASLPCGGREPTP